MYSFPNNPTRDIYADIAIDDLCRAESKEVAIRKIEVSFEIVR